MIYKLRMVMKCLCSKKKLRLLHRIACRLKIHNINGSLIPNDKNWFQAQIMQDIAIRTQFEHERHSTHKRVQYNIFTKERHPQAYTSQNYQEHN
jgi:hypothetical protein